MPGTSTDGRLRSASASTSSRNGHCSIHCRRTATDCGIDLTPAVHRNGRVTVGQCYYSVPAKFIGRLKVRVKLKANELWIYGGWHVVAARHPRLTRRYTFHDILEDHYLEILLVKPGAFVGASALAQARAEGGFTKTHEALWAAAKQKAGDGEGIRLLIEVLLLHRQLSAHAVVAGITTVLGIGSVSTDLVAIEFRKAIEDTEEEHDTSGQDRPDEEPAGGPVEKEVTGGAKVVFLHARRLPADSRRVPCGDRASCGRLPPGGECTRDRSDRS
ncbi:Mu transposase domain-containing protein [Streptomyces sp. NPDC090445]|uniref:Mu transposase domain-containing protein n=1 Tax=Streptomyces sp. NPDC090445 TaxID=3365963 RepID=UPI003815BFF4